MNKGHLTARYSEFLFQSRDLMDMKLMRGKLEEKVLVDIGCGTHYRDMVRLAGIYGAGKYLGADMRVQDSEWTHHGMGVVVARSDMLEFVSRLPSGSANFLINGIDFLGSDERYLRLMIGELARAAYSGGVIFGRGSEPVEGALEQSPHFARNDYAFPYGRMSGFFFFEKR